ncbi:TIGR02677 family protein [Streptacidiphilus carbonis]|uniref:TIGR02677 family protein n=1 Tax=Streptacidiphilus carbonis TaxID=105422 RepID=UPI0007C66293|nr:TIGR02677 family protein [Streptacidiphilus carbonis]
MTSVDDTLANRTADDVDRDGGPGTYQPFAHLTVEHSALYRQVMGVFVRAKQEFSVHLRPEDVHLALAAEGRPPLEVVARALEALARWGNLRADPDTGRVTALEDFYRSRYIYQLSRAGEAAEEALAAYDEALGRRGELQAVALADIAVQLRALLALAGREDPDPAVVHLALLALVDRFSGLAENARAFMNSLQRTVDLHEAEVDVFLAYKQRLIEYLERFIEDLVTRGAEIAGLLEELGVWPDGRVGPLLLLAAEREASDAAPDAAAEALAAAERRWRGRWDGLRAWFLSVPGRNSQAKLLRSAARQAIPQLLAVVQVLNERRAGRSDRSADFRELARWFAQAPDDNARHRLWRSAFGLYSARHLTIDQEALAERLEDPVPASASWYDAPGVRISPQLRRTGSYERRGRARAVQDRSEARTYLAELARKQAEQTAAARARLATRGEIRLSDLDVLDRDAFRLFLQLLGDALSAWRPGLMAVSATTNDGTMEIRLIRLPGEGTAEVHTHDGVLRGPEHLVEIVDLTVGDEADVSGTSGGEPENDVRVGAEAAGAETVGSGQG